MKLYCGVYREWGYLRHYLFGEEATYLECQWLYKIEILVRVSRNPFRSIHQLS